MAADSKTDQLGKAGVKLVLHLAGLLTGGFPTARLQGHLHLPTLKLVLRPFRAPATLAISLSLSGALRVVPHPDGDHSCAS